jgi:hypothetical protein
MGVVPVDFFSNCSCLDTFLDNCIRDYQGAAITIRKILDWEHSRVQMIMNNDNHRDINLS